ncbi:hypothetical protein C8J57DRAFT_1046954 [Mycena rebaudengoi]|nr:hypothetical protein C8J57DRAFT_1046954 [Mycena rebaudengoi]
MSEVFHWSSPEGHALVRRIVEHTPLTYIPHDHQCEGVCKSLDGIHLFAVTPTGSGKISYYIIYILVIPAVLDDPSLCPSAKFPENPCLLVICPTIPLQLEMKVGLKVLAINSLTRSDAQRLSNEDLWLTARAKCNVILTGPEQLKCADFEKALRDPMFFDRVCGTGVDEVHVLNTWGASFRKDFQQNGHVQARLSDQRNPWILTSATVRPGAPFNNICRLLGLQNYRIIRRSCARPDLRIIFRDLLSPITGDSFPELDFIIREKRPTILFAKSIPLGSRVYCYLLCHANLSVDSNRIRMYNSLNFESYNTHTRELMKLDASDPQYCQVIIGTDTLSVDVAMRARLDAILIGDVDDTDELLQKLGRINREKCAEDARGIIFASLASRKQAEKLLADEAAGISKPGQTPPDLSMARLIVAKCKVQEQNLIYDNPVSDPPCTCLQCTESSPPPPPTSCNCSGCLPETLPAPTPASRAPKPSDNIPPKDRLSRLQKAHGTKALLDLRLEIWRHSDQSKYWMYAPHVFLPDRLITRLLDKFSLLHNLDAVTLALKPHLLLASYPIRLLEALEALKPEFVTIAADRKAENAQKLKAKKEAEADAKRQLESQNDSEDGEDVMMVNAIEEAVELRFVPHHIFTLLTIRSRRDVTMKSVNEKRPASVKSKKAKVTKTMPM